MPDEEVLDTEVPATPDNLEDAFQNLFRTSVSAGGEEELLKIASDYSCQFSARQIKAILYLEWLLPKLEEPHKTRMRHFIDGWREMKRYNNSDAFVMRALDSISLRKFIGENSVKVNIEK